MATASKGKGDVQFRLTVPQTLTPRTKVLIAWRKKRKAVEKAMNVLFFFNIFSSVIESCTYRTRPLFGEQTLKIWRWLSRAHLNAILIFWLKYITLSIVIKMKVYFMGYYQQP